MSSIPEWLYEYLLQLPALQLVEIMADALDLMNQYNGRTHTFCIVSSIEDALVTETDNGYEYQLPKIVDNS